MICNQSSVTYLPASSFVKCAIYSRLVSRKLKYQGITAVRLLRQYISDVQAPSQNISGQSVSLAFHAK